MAKADGTKTGGRQKGTPNKITSDARWAITAFVNQHADKLNGWLDEIYAAHGPKDAYDRLLATFEYAVPKLARTEMQALDDKGEKSDGFKITVEHVTK